MTLPYCYSEPAIGSNCLYIERAGVIPQEVDPEEKSEYSAVTEVSIARSLDDVPYGHEVVKIITDPDVPADLSQLAETLGAQEEEEKSEPVYLCLGRRYGTLYHT